MTNMVFSRSATSIITLSSLFLLLLTPRIAHSQTAYYLANNGSRLLSLDLQSPGNTSSISTFANGFTLEAIDFRPSTGMLYGYDFDTESTYTIDPRTGSVSLIDNSPLGLTSNFVLGMDFDPRQDRIRVVTANQENVTFDPDGTTDPVSDPSLSFAAGDRNAGISPFIVENAYTNNIIGTGLPLTTSYVIDANLDILARLDDATGQLSTVGALGPAFDTSGYVGFDIFTSLTGVNTAYAILDSTLTATDPRLYTIDLETGTVTEVGKLGSGEISQAYGLAIAPIIPAVIPEASSLALLMSVITLTTLMITYRRPDSNLRAISTSGRG